METERILDFEIFQNLTREETEKILSDSETVSLKKGQVLFQEGDVELSFYIVVEGEILVYKAEKKVAARRAGEYLGEMALIDDSPRSASAKATKPSVLLKIGEKSFEALISANSSFASKLLKTLVARTREDLGALNQGYRKLRNQKRKASHLHRILDDTTNEIYTFDHATFAITRMNRRSQENLGYSLDEVKGLTPLDLLEDISRERLETLLRPLIAETQTLVSFEGNQKRKDGTTYPVEIRFQIMEADHALVIVAIAQDVSERVALSKKIRQLAYFDDLTLLPNRNSLLEDVAEAIKDADQEKIRFALFHIDLDRFKNVNDSLGHQGGDILLRDACQRLTSEFAKPVRVYRLQGDEFAILVPEIATRNDASALAEKIMSLMDGMFHVHSYDIHLTCSIGIALFPFHGNSAITLVENTDLALTQAKQLGKAQYNFYDSSLEPLALNKLALVSGLKNALEKDHFFLEYQPKVDARTKLIVGAEALIRWNHPEMGRISPGEFIPIAEESGLIVAMGQWVLRKASAQLNQWHQMGFTDLCLSVNFSGIQFSREDAVSSVRAILEEKESAKKGLELELTESVIMENTKAAINKMNAFRALGLGLSIDDFGTGYSSLQYIKDMPVNCLKIDRCFVRGIESKANQVIVRTIVNLAKMLNMTTVVEGVETVEEDNIVEMIGCDQIQGFLYSRPVSPEILKNLLEKQTSATTGH